MIVCFLKKIIIFTDKEMENPFSSPAPLDYDESWLVRNWVDKKLLNNRELEIAHSSRGSKIPRKFSGYPAGSAVNHLKNAR